MTGRRISRIELLRGGRAKAPVRPPWARPEGRFVQRCTRCAACREACPEGIIRPGRGGFPEIDFRRGGCTFCGRCAAVCEAGAFRAPDGAPWALAAAVGAACLTARRVLCRACADACDAGAIAFTRAPVPAPRVDAGRCTGCGACVAPCPTAAIELGPRARSAA